MKRTLVTQGLPAIIVLALAWLFLGRAETGRKIFGDQPLPDSAYQSSYIYSLHGNPSIERFLLSSGDSSDNIFLFGSSELTGDFPGHSFRFISSEFKTKVVGVGEAGNQCFSIYSMLLAKRDVIKNAPVCIILSPGWFAGDAALGTTSTIFAEYNSERFVKLIYDQPDDSFRSYFVSRVSDYYPDWGSPSAIYRQIYLENIASKNPLNAAYTAPLRLSASAISCAGEKFSAESFSDFIIKRQNRKPIVTENIPINWDSIFTASKTAVLAQATNNDLAVNNTYFTEQIQGNRGKIRMLDRAQNRELDDFHQLVRLLKASGVNASFVILPMNPLYYENLPVLDPIIEELDSTVKKNGFQVFNMFTSDKTKFEKGILNDVVHPSNYGWYKIDEFIIRTYHLTP